jgi:endonuclease YncB( thermonuclease family)
MLDGLTAALVLIGLVAIAAYLLPQGDVLTGFATVVDGDTLHLDGERIRISGIDAPELHQSCERQGRPYACGEVAKQALDDMLGGRPLTCRSSGRDRYNRRLATCEAGGIDIGAAMVSRGYAVAYGHYSSEEAAARRQKLELWSGSFERPSEWRKEHSAHERADRG